jgi:hypothetical protein
LSTSVAAFRALDADQLQLIPAEPVRRATPVRLAFPVRLAT